MKKIQLVGLTCLAVALGAFAADRTEDGYGLVEALTGTAATKDTWPFRFWEGAFSSATSGSPSGKTIDRSGPNTWAPESVYQLERYGGDISTTFSKLVPGAAYKVELHLAETWFGVPGNGGGGAGSRVFNVSVNGTSVETGVDIYKQAGGPLKALVKQYECTAKADGTVVVRMQKTSDNARFGGIAIFGKATPAKPALVGTRILGTADLKFTWGAGTDTHRYYLQRSTAGETGPWTLVGTPLTAEVRETTLANMDDPTTSVYYRMVASNGVGVATSDVVHFAPGTATTDGLATTGSTVADKPSAVYGVTTIGDAAAGSNTLAADNVTAAGYLLEVDGDSTLALGEGQTFTVGTFGVGDYVRTLTVQGAGTLAAKGGQLSVAAGHADARVLVTAPVAGGGAGTLVKNGPGTATFAGGLSGFGTYALNAGAFVISNNTDVTEGTVVGGVADFVKAGTGVLTVTSENPDLAGDVIVKEGTLRFGRKGSVFADATGKLIVEPGAALDVATSDIAEQGVNLGARTVVVSGAGPDGKGAIVNGGKCQYNALKNGELADDVVFGGGGANLSETTGRWDFRNGTLNLNGHNIRKVGKNMVCLTGIALTGDTGVTIDVAEGYWSSETTTSYSGGSQNAFNIASGAYLDLYNMSLPLTWTLNLADGSYLQVRNGTAAKNHFEGPVNLAAGTVNLLAKENTYATLDGVVSGEGRLKSVSANGGRVTLANPANTYTGGTIIQGGDLAALYKGSLPGYEDPAKLMVTNATLIVPISDGANGTWSADDVQDLASRGQLKTFKSFVGFDVAATQTVSRGLVIPLGGLAKYGPGMLIYNESVDLQDGAYNHFEGATVFAGAKNHRVKHYIQFRRGEMALLDGASLETTTSAGDVQIGTIKAETARMVVSNATLRTQTPVAYNTASTAVLVGAGSSNEWNLNPARGILDVYDDAVVSNKYIVGHGLRAQGALRQWGGRVVNCGGAANDIRLGNYGYGYLELNDGYHEWMGYGQVGSQGAQARGVFVQHGGTFVFSKVHDGRMAMNRSKGGGHGEIYQDGGLFQLKSFMEMGEQDNKNGGTSWWTVDGDASAYVQDYVIMANRTNHTAVLNLNGGVFETKYVTARSQVAADHATARAFVNFDGGTFKCRAAGEIFKSAEKDRPDAVTIYAGGATFDTAGHAAKISVPLLKPTGKGIASISVPTRTDYIGSPVFTITGDGTGATAHAVCDPANGTVTAVKITSPGTGYTTATVTSTDGGVTNVVAATVTLAENATTGGLVKKGAGSLTLNAANTFGGAVTVEAGTLALATPRAFPEGNDLNLAGGHFDGNGATITAGVVRVTSGSLENVTIICESFEKTGSGILSVSGAEIRSKSGTVFADGRLLVGSAPGLRSGKLSGASNWTDPNPATDVELTCSKAEIGSTDNYGENITYVYSGYIWNRSADAAAWTFGANFDDYVRVWIDGNLILEQTDCWTGVKGTVTLTPGPHRFEARFSNGAGDGGRVTGNTVKNWDLKPPPFGFAIDFEGRDTFTAANFTVPVDPGDGTLFTTVPTDDFVVSLTNLTTGAVEVWGDLAVKGTWTLDAANLLAGKVLESTGQIDLSGITELVFEDGADLPKKATVLARAAEGFTGDPAALLEKATGLPRGTWSIYVAGDELRLNYAAGTTVFIR